MTTMRLTQHAVPCVMQMERVMAGVAAEVAPLVRAKGRPQRVACLEWNDPLMGCGHWCGAVLWAHNLLALRT